MERKTKDRERERERERKERGKSGNTPAVILICGLSSLPLLLSLRAVAVATGG